MGLSRPEDLRAPVCRLAIRDERAGAVMADVAEAATSLGREISAPLTPALVERCVFDVVIPLLASEGFEQAARPAGSGGGMRTARNGCAGALTRRRPAASRST